MSLRPALEILDELRDELREQEQGLEGDPALTLVLRVLVLVLAEGRGRLREVEGALSELSGTKGDAWERLLAVFARVQAVRGGGLFEARRLGPGLRLGGPSLARLLEVLSACAEAELEILGSVYEAARSGSQRRQRSTHYTPSALAAEIVARTLEPLVRERAPAQLRVCDPAMGSGAFVLAACRWLGARLGPRGSLRAGLNGVFGVDIDPGAVELARLSLWFECEAEELPWTCFDHNLRCGDALVGLEPEQLRRGHWIPARGAALASEQAQVEAALAGRERVRVAFEGLAGDLDREGAAARAASMATFGEAQVELEERARTLLAAFFSSTKNRAREQARTQAGPPKVVDGHPPLPRPCHWWLAFPQLGPQGFDAVVGNPPFLGKNGLLGQRGRAYLDWLKLLHPGAHGNADYAAHFFRRALTLIGEQGTIGLLATNTIAQGDTRATGLAPMVAAGCEIYAVDQHVEWPGAAKVTVSVVHLARGPACAGLERRLSGRRVEAIDSRLRAGPERPDPHRLAANRSLAFIGTYVLGRGFVLDAEQREALLDQRAANAERIRPYLGGERLNASPTHDSGRWAIDFGAMSLAEAGRWPELLEHLRVRVKPQRERLSDNPDGRRRRRYWWQHGRVTPSLEAALAPLSRCLVASLVSKHLMFAFVPARQLFAHKLCVFPLESAAALAVLQSRVHRIWAWRHSSTMRNAGINYSPSDCFETFPLPRFDAELERVGTELHEARAAYMRGRKHGLTKTYDALADTSREQPALEHLRALHLALDRATLAAYGWEGELELPGYGVASDCFEVELLERLYALNSSRASEAARA